MCVYLCLNYQKVGYLNIFLPFVNKIGPYINMKLG